MEMLKSRFEVFFLFSLEGLFSVSGQCDDRADII